MLPSKARAFWCKSPLLFRVLVLLLIAAAALYLWSRPSSRLAGKARLIKRGDSKEMVVKALGKPTAVLVPPTGTNVNFATLLLCVHSETWAYGQTLCMSQDFPYVGFKLRLFQPDTNDIAITFDSDGKVANVLIPRVGTR